MAEQNFRQYGCPIPAHLQASVAEIAPDLGNTISTATSQSGRPTETKSSADIEHSIRLAAGMGKIEEVDIAPVPKRTDEKWRRLGNGEFEHLATGKVRLGRDGKPRRPPKRRNSEDIRRDQMVDTVLSESKRKTTQYLMTATSDTNSRLLRCTSIRQPACPCVCQQRRRHPRTIPSRLLRIRRRCTTAAAQSRTSSQQRRAERAETRWLQER